jgi:hypothetical protein
MGDQFVHFSLDVGCLTIKKNTPPLPAPRSKFQNEKCTYIYATRQTDEPAFHRLYSACKLVYITLSKIA